MHDTDWSVSVFPSSLSVQPIHEFMYINIIYTYVT